MEHYAIGMDFGTLSARTVLVRLSDGEIMAQAVSEYASGVLDRALPDGTRLPPDWALQDPRDYLTALFTTVPQVVREAGVEKEAVVGLSLDFTSCTILPLDKEGRPLCMEEAWVHEPHAWVKLWKHHGAQKQADRMTAVAKARGERFLDRCGGKAASEWLFPKVMEILDEAPAVYEAADRIMEAGDWITMVLTGQSVRSSAFAGYKGQWSKGEGYPSAAFLKALDPRLERFYEDGGRVDVLGGRAGSLTAEMAQRLGLCAGTAVGVPIIDAHSAFSAVGVTRAGELLAILGTSGCDLLLGDEEKPVPGICGVVEDGMLPGLFGYEAGQCCFGDHFAWVAENCCPEAYAREAAERGMSLHQLLTEKAAKLAPGETGLLALDWWNGNRSVLVDADLTGMILGMTLTTRPEEIYRAMLESVAFGKRVVFENYEDHGVPIRRVYATGGIARKNPLLMQILADVLDKEIYLDACLQGAAVGAAIFGAVAAGKERGGYDSVYEAAEKMGRYDPEPYRPNRENKAVYDALYREFVTLHDYFGRGGNDVMKRLKALKRGV